MDRLVVPATLDSLQAIGQYVLAAAATAHFDAKASYAMRLAIDEIATNVITHGFPNRAHGGEIVISANVEQDGLTIVMEDEGLPYEPLDQRGTVKVDQPLDQRPIGGLGLFLAINSVDEFSYERQGNCNRHKLFIRRQMGPSNEFACE